MFFRAIIVLLLTVLPATAGDVSLLMVRAKFSNGYWHFHVTAHHPDTGHEHMLDTVTVFSPDGDVLGTSVLSRPSYGSDHISTKIMNVTIPSEIDHVLIKAHCNVDGWSEPGMVIDLH